MKLRIEHIHFNMIILDGVYQSVDSAFGRWGSGAVVLKKESELRSDMAEMKQVLLLEDSMWRSGERLGGEVARSRHLFERETSENSISAETSGGHDINDQAIARRFDVAGSLDRFACGTNQRMSRTPVIRMTSENAQAIKEFNRRVHRDPRVEIAMLPVGEGLTLLRVV